MADSKELNVALKEWAVVCAALESGRQILLLRKGGIYESRSGFELENSEFLLFPTYLHQNAQMLKEPQRAELMPAAAEPATVRISSWGKVMDIVRVKSREQIDAIEAEHVWASPLIDMRFNYKPQNPLYLLLVRVSRLNDAVTIANTPAYAGCKSWVPLSEPVEIDSSEPVLSEAQYAAKQKAILQRIGE